MTKRVCVVKGEDAAPEVVVPTVKILEELNLDIEFMVVSESDNRASSPEQLIPSDAMRPSRPQTSL